MRQAVSETAFENTIDCEEDKSFLDMKKSKAPQLFGLKAYCDTYDRMSDSFVLSPDDKQVDDCHVRVQLSNEECIVYVVLKMLLAVKLLD